ncbi:MAG: hypothetical protein FWE55_05055 [Synergistaceae bacterium]|nr:hypothetical protein [Synergistaceae bacterium]
MEKVSLSNMEAFKIIDHTTGEIFHGCSQDWFGTYWQRLSGCGPSVVTNILMYRDSTRDLSVSDKKAIESLMEEVWKFVTPTARGIPTVEMLLERVMSYGEARGMKTLYRNCDVPREKSLRPSIEAVISFIGDSLERDVPVAFLNLCNGDERTLDDWHWVTVVEMEHRASDGHAVANILDRGRIMPVDLSLWLETTTNGGGFLYFTFT